MARKPQRRSFLPQRTERPVSKLLPQSEQTCQGEMCSNKRTRDWYLFQPSGMQIKVLYCAECLEHAMRQERQL